MKKSSNFRHITGPIFKSSIAMALLSTALIAPSANAEVKPGYTNYVTDSVEVPMRREAGYSYKIIRMLKSGTAVTILKVNNKGWAQVVYKRKGTSYTGWMPSTVLQNQSIAKVRLERQVKKMNAVEEKYNALKQELDTLQKRFDTTSTTLSTIKQEKFEADQQLNRLKAISSNAVALDGENQEMKIRIGALEDQNAIMKEQIDQSEDTIKRQWFLTGGGVLLLGLLIGRFFKAPGRRNKWGEI